LVRRKRRAGAIKPNHPGLLVCIKPKRENSRFRGTAIWTEASANPILKGGRFIRLGLPKATEILTGGDSLGLENSGSTVEEDLLVVKYNCYVRGGKTR